MEKRGSWVLDLERVHALKTWLKENNIKLTQINGQRKYGGPPEGWDGPMPGANCEVFISHIPRDVYEDLLIPLFSSVGPLWEFRLMMNFSGQNRGFAYAKYSSSSVADTAICLLHGYPLAPGVRLSVCHSTEKRHLCIDGLPATTRQGDLFQVLQLLVEGVERVSLMKGPGTGGVSAMVAFLSHHTASMAKKVLVEAFKKHFLLDVWVQWQSAEARPSPDKTLLPGNPTRGPRGTKPPRHVPNSPQLSVPPASSASRPRTPPGFCRAVGGPTGPCSVALPGPPPSLFPLRRGI
ncbi:dead end protein 1-like [Echeneis naucrates]|uniref:dead end protein 1-like n=1 Tax=Echeneis naucrates TaxID=173247 RepID=UPI0011135E1C|nr:dead end protein 1-like [Echeneis naucrates]